MPPELCNHIASTSSGDDSIISSSQTQATSSTSIKSVTESSNIIIATPSVEPSLSTTSGMYISMYNALICLLCTVYNTQSR